MHGRFNTTKGEIVMDKTGNTSTVDIVIDAASVDTGMKKRDNHLCSPDFLNAAESPEITYKSSKITFNGATRATVDGTLTISGASKAGCAKHQLQYTPDGFEKRKIRVRF